MNWRRWIKMAVGSFEAGNALLDAEKAHSAGAFNRSAISRYYYSAYQAMTALLLYEGQEPPVVDGVQRDSWNHIVTPDMVFNNLGNLVKKKSDRYDMRRRLAELYKARLYADYAGDHPPNIRSVESARRDAGFLVKVAESYMPDVDGEES